MQFYYKWFNKNVLCVISHVQNEMWKWSIIWTDGVTSNPLNIKTKKVFRFDTGIEPSIDLCKKAAALSFQKIDMCDWKFDIQNMVLSKQFNDVLISCKIDNSKDYPFSWSIIREHEIANGETFTLQASFSEIDELIKWICPEFPPTDFHQQQQIARQTYFHQKQIQVH